MKLAIRHTVSFSLLLASFASALDRPASRQLRTPSQQDDAKQQRLLRQLQQQDTNNNQEYQAFLSFDDKTCTEELAECRVYLPNGLPLAEWGNALAKLDPAEHTLTLNLKQLVTNLEAADFDTVGDSLINMMDAGADVNRQAVEELLKEMGRNMALLREEEEGGVDPLRIQETGITWFTDFLAAVINVIGFIFHIDTSKPARVVMIFGQIADLMFGVLFAIPQGPVGILTTLVSNLFQIAGLVGQLLLLALGLDGLSPTQTENAAIVAETTCLVNMVRCESEKIILNLMPSLLGGVILVDNAKAAAAEAETASSATVENLP